MSAERLWQAALGQLQLEMPRATFDTWVRDAELLAHEAVEAEGDVEDEVLLLQPAAAGGAGVVTAVAGVDHDAPDAEAELPPADLPIEVTGESFETVTGTSTTLATSGTGNAGKGGAASAAAASALHPATSPSCSGSRRRTARRQPRPRRPKPRPRWSRPKRPRRPRCRQNPFASR